MPELTNNQRAMIAFMGRSDVHASHGFELILKRSDPEIFFNDLRTQGHFDPAKNPPPEPVSGQEGYVRIPFWPALGYLKCVASVAGKKNDTRLGNEVMDVTRAILSEGGRIDNYHTHAAIAEIFSSVPTTCVDLADVHALHLLLKTRYGNSLSIRALSDAIERFLHADDPDGPHKAIALLEICTELRAADEGDRSTRSHVSIADDYWLEQLLKKNADSLGATGKGAAVDCLCVRLRTLFSDDYISENSWLWRAAIEDHEQNHDWDHLTNSFVESTRDALSAWARTEIDGARSYVASLIGDGSQIVRRIAFHTMRIQWDQLGNDLINLLQTNHFSDFGHLHEIYLLLEEHFADLPQVSQSHLIDAIESITSEGVHDGKEAERADYVKRNWFAAMRGKGRADVDARFAELSEKLGPLRPYPSLISYHTTSVGSGTSPYSKDEILVFAKDRSLVDRFNSYKPDPRNWQDSRKSLVDTVASAVCEAPEHFNWLIKYEPTSSRQLQYALLSGLSKFFTPEVIKDRPALSSELIGPTSSYMRDLTADDAFWSEIVVDTGAFEPTRDWIPQVITELVKKLVGNDALPIPETAFADLLSVCTVIIEKADGIEPTDDAMTATINNPRGTAVESLLQLALRQCRDQDKEFGSHEIAWSQFEPLLSDELAGCKDGHRLESSTMFAYFLPQLIYMSESWTTDKCNRIFPKDQTKNFVSAISGLSFANFDSKTYQVLKSADIPTLATESADVTKSSRERLIERIALAYMWGLESLDGPPIQLMFHADRKGDLAELLTAIGRWAGASLEEEQTERAKSLAARSVAFALDDVSARRHILVAASKFIGYVSTLDEPVMSWLEPTAKFAHIGYSGEKFLASLDRLASSYGVEVLRLLERFLEDYSLHLDYNEHVKSTILKLNGAGLHRQSILLVDKLIQKGAGTQWVELYKQIAGVDAASAE